MLLTLASILLSSIMSSYADLDSTSPLINVSAVQRQTAELPCDVTPPSPDDELRLVLWYYGTGGTPVYTYDARDRGRSRGAHWTDASVDSSRVQFQPNTRQAHLRIGAVRRSDQRLYRCRVDFLHSPTRNSRVNLTVISECLAVIRECLAVISATPPPTVDASGSSRMLLTLASILLSSIMSSYADLDSTSPLINVSAVQRQTAELPCDVTPPSPDDELRLVLWYYGTGGTPVYTYDARDRGRSRGAHWTDASVDSSRVQFQPNTRPAHLRIGAVRRSDQRLYRCRVDFLHSPTRNSRVNLTVITPPGRPTILNAGGHAIERLTRRRYREGEMVQLTCSSSGGNPPPNITWWQDSELLDSSWHQTPSGSIQNHVTVGPLTRADVGQEYTCWATNHVQAPPKSTAVAIDMLLRPLSVRLLGSNNPLSAGVTYQLVCQSAGSRPAAVISWWKDGRELTATDEVREEVQGTGGTRYG
ncbi:uncharacterized protein LOC119099657, partial [Pollicipes pollicipes]|uniref:uncharacterized protein LOC119099657 n=1 Tax=Pollicipes pollicipes TaxID=41117 RepID=UPI00188491D7